MVVEDYFFAWEGLFLGGGEMLVLGSVSVYLRKV